MVMNAHGHKPGNESIWSWKYMVRYVLYRSNRYIHGHLRRYMVMDVQVYGHEWSCSYIVLQVMNVHEDEHS